jgi:hypothetical protein
MRSRPPWVEPDGMAHCEAEGCEATWPRSDWKAGTAEGWFFSKDGGTVMCPAHLTPGIIQWRAWKAEQKQTSPRLSIEPVEANLWTGDDDHVRGTFVDLRPDRNRHEHGHVEGGLFYHSHPKGSVPHTHGPQGGYRKLRVPEQAEGNEQHDRGPHERPPRLGPVHEADYGADGSQDDGDQEEQLSR